MLILSVVLLCVVNCVLAESMELLDPTIGFIPDCPGALKPADIKPKSLKKLTMSVLGSGPLVKANWTSYNYYRIRHLVDHPEIDFKTKKTALYVPGYLDNNGAPVGRGFGELYKKMGYNVIILDAVHFTGAGLWPIVVRLMRPVGKHAAEMLVTLTELGLNPKDLELVGISLGGQIMSFIAKNYRNITGQTIGRLTAVEPTGPCLRNLGPDQRLDKSDGDFVLHIASGIHGLGIQHPSGHVTFFVNGGVWQQSGIWWIPCGLICSHIRALFIWVSALQSPGQFIGVLCETAEKAIKGDCFQEPKVTNTLDMFTDQTKPGIYFLATRNRYPYYLGRKGVDIKSGFEFANNFLAKINKQDMMWV